MTREHLPFIDWLKCVGIILIVNGHVGEPILSTAPIYEKQLGVALFIFVMGFSLARETRASWLVVYRRLFELYLFGIALAALLGATGYVFEHDIHESNFAPFVFGANVLLNYFPANPTTWFLGTYLHLLLIWAVILRGVTIRRWMIASVLVAEIVVRAVLVRAGAEMIAYMITPNWATAFLLGTYEGQRFARQSSDHFTMAAVVLAALLIGWPIVVRLVPMSGGFPFRHPVMGSASLSILTMSLMISTLYAGYAWSCAAVAERLPDFAVVRFFARNTPIIFLAHMPVDYLLAGPLEPLRAHHALVVAIRLLACLVAVAIASEGIRAIVKPDLLRERVLRAFTSKWPRVAVGAA